MQQVSLDEAVERQWPILEPIAGPRENPVAINRPVCLIGSRARVNLLLPSPQVSRAHALILIDKRGVYLRDLASLNHVYVNDKPVREQLLDDGDVVRIGSFAFRCERGFRRAEKPTDSHLPPVGLEAESDHTRIPLVGRTTVLGTRKECDVLLTDPKAAPAHAVVFELDGQRYIRDLRTAAGTFVNDKRVEQAELKPGDVIRIGDTPLRFDVMPEAISEAETIPLAAEESDGKASPAGEDLDIIPFRADQEAASPPDEPVLSLRDDEDKMPLSSSHDSGSGLAALEDIPVQVLGDLTDSQHPGQELERPAEEKKDRSAKSSPEGPGPRRRGAPKVRQSSP